MRNRDNITIIAYVNNIASTTDSISTTVTTFAMANGSRSKIVRDLEPKFAYFYYCHHYYYSMDIKPIKRDYVHATISKISILLLLLRLLLRVRL